MKKVLLFVPALFLIFSCNNNDKQRIESNVSSIAINNKVYTASIHENLAVFCTGKKDENSAKRICGKYLSKDKIFVLHELSDKTKSVMPAKVYNNQIVWVEYKQQKDNSVLWELFTKTIHSKDTTHLIISNKNNPLIEFPHFDISDSLIVFDYFTPIRKDSLYFSIYMYNYHTTKIQRIPVPKNYSGYNPSFNGASHNEVVCCLISFDKGNKPVSKIAINKIAEKEWILPDCNLSGFQPSMYGKKIVYKECTSPYAYGTIQLYDLETREKTTLSNHCLGGELPQINQNFVVWESPSFDQIPAYNHRDNTLIKLYTGLSGKPYLKNNSLIWVVEDESSQVLLKIMKL